MCSKGEVSALEYIKKPWVEGMQDDKSKKHSACSDDNSIVYTSVQGIVAARASAVLVDAYATYADLLDKRGGEAGDGRDAPQLRPAGHRSPVQSRLETHPSTIIYIAILLRAIMKMPR